MKLQTLFLAAALVLALAPAAPAQRPPEVPRVTIDELKTLMKKKTVLVIDVRNMVEFGEGHIPGAMNVPYGEPSKVEEQLRKEKRTIVLYCACPHEASALRAADEMGGLGIPNIKVLQGGWHEWVNRGEKVEKGGGAPPQYR